MSERRKFARQLETPGSASLIRENASSALQEQNSSTAPKLVDPIDFEHHTQKNRTILYNDPQRELVLFPADDVASKELPRRPRTHGNSVPDSVRPQSNGEPSAVTNHLARQCINFYISDWHIVQYKYSRYGGGYHGLSKDMLAKAKKNMPAQKFEIDEHGEGKSVSAVMAESTIRKGHLFVGPERLTETLNPSNFSKFFKRRFLILKRMPDGAHCLEEHRDDKRLDQRDCIFLDLAESISEPPIGANAGSKFLFELKMIGSRSYMFAAETSAEQQQWMSALHRILHPGSAATERQAPPPPQNESSPAAYNESVQKCLSNYNKETERTIATSRNKSHQKLLFLFPELHAAADRSPYLPGEDPVLCQREEASAEEKAPFSEQAEGTHRFRITCQKFRLQLQAEMETNTARGVRDNPEPFFLIFCLINVREGRKVSEDFFWYPNSPEVSNMIPAHVFQRKSPHQEAPHHDDIHASMQLDGRLLSTCKTCIFSVTQADVPDVYLFVRVEKVLSGSINQAVEKYIKAPDQRVANAVHKTMLPCCDNIGHYRMPFGWTARALRCPMDESNLKLFKMESSKLSEEDLIKLVQNINRTEKTAKWQTIPCDLLVAVEELSYNCRSTPNRDSILADPQLSTPPFLLSPTLEPVLADGKPAGDRDSSLSVPLGPLVREAEEFMHEGQGAESFATPYLSYFNCLFLYPRCLNYSGQNSFPRARNLSCFAELRDGDDEVMSRSSKDLATEEMEGRCLKVFYTRPSPHQSAFSTWANTTVCHHESSPAFNDELKLCLPPDISPRHHLLFRFFHVSCETAASAGGREKSGGKRHVEQGVGYAWLPLLDREGRIQTGDHNLRVCVNLPSGYLDHRMSSGALTYVEGGKELFKVTLRLRSSILTREPLLHRFFAFCGTGLVDAAGKPKQVDAQAANLLKALLAVDLPTIIAFLPAVFNQLLQIVTLVTNENIAQTAISVIVMLLAKLTNKASEKIEVRQRVMDNYKTVLKAYVKFAFSGDAVLFFRGRTVHEELVRHAFSLLKPSNLDGQTVFCFLANLWFFLEVVAKSMAQHLLTTSRIKMNRTERFTNDFKVRLKNLFFALVSHLIQGLRAGRNKEDLLQANTSLAFFLRRLLSLSDRGFVFQLIHQYFTDVHTAETAKETAVPVREELRRIKLVFLKVVCNHEHYVQLNIPSSKFSLMKDIRAEFFLTADFCTRHYLVGLVLLQLQHALREGSHEVRKLAIRIVRDLLAKHTSDDRHKSRSHQTRVASLYLPLLNLVLENRTVLKEFAQPGASQEGPGAFGLHRSNSMSSVSTAPTPRSIKSFTLPSAPSRLERPPSYAPSETGLSTSSASVHSAGAKSSRCSTLSAAASNGKVDSDILNQIAGVGPGGSLSGLIPGVSNLVPSRGSDWNSSGGTLASGSQLTLSGGSRTGGRTTATGSNSTLTGVGDEMMDTEQLAESSSNLCRGRGLKKDTLMDKEQQDLLISFLHIVTTVGDDVLAAWLNNLSINDRGDFFDVLLICLRQFHYRGKAAISNLEKISRIDVHPKRSSLVSGSALTGSGRLRRQLASSLIEGSASLPPSGDKTDGQPAGVVEAVLDRKLSLCAAILRRDSMRPDETASVQSQMEANLSAEVGLIVLDVACLYADQFRSDLLGEGGDHPLFRRLLDVLLCFLKTNQSEALLRHAFSALRLFISRFSSCLFTNGSASACGSICHVVLRCCNSRLESVRMEACGLLHRLMRTAHEVNGHMGFTRVHLQMIISVSRLVSELADLNSPRFQSSLSFLNSLGQSDRSVPRSGNNFVEEVKDLTKRIRTVLMATAQMKEHEHDPEMIVDLKYSLAQSYATTPALRKTWLDGMAKVHITHNNLSEVAHCKIHVAALVAEYLKRRGVLKREYPQGCSAFAPISPNIAREESGIRDDTGMLDEQYSQADLVQLLEEAFDAFNAAERWEVLAHIAHLLEPIYLAERNFVALQSMHTKLAKGYELIVNAKRRFLGTFYRVAFYGQPFADQDGKVFVYKEPALTQLPDICDRLKMIFSKKFRSLAMEGQPAVQLLMESKVDPAKLNPRQAYIQVTHVKPYFESSEDDERQTEFERQHNVCRFSFETPFTKTGSAHSENIAEQWKRRTVIKTSHSLPFVKKRVEVVKQRERDLSPIEGAIDEIRRKANEVAEAVSARDSNLLQLRLGGIVNVQVNAGPVAYAEAFLDKEKRNAYPAEKVKQLKIAFEDLLTQCLAALKLNSELISSTLLEYHQTMKEGFQKLRIKVCELVGEELQIGGDVFGFRDASSDNRLTLGPVQPDISV